MGKARGLSANLHLVWKSEVAKVEVENGLVLGWGMVCTEKGEDHYDLQGDHIPESVMVKSTTDFMLNSRVAKEMHTGEAVGSIVHSFPLTKDAADKLGIITEKTGWLVAMKPDDPAVLQKYIDGTYTGFSIGGTCAYVADERQAA